MNKYSAYIGRVSLSASVPPNDWPGLRYEARQWYARRSTPQLPALVEFPKLVEFIGELFGVAE